MPLNKRKLIYSASGLAALATALVLGLSFYFSSATIYDLLVENHQLNKAIYNLTDEQEIGYAIVESQQITDTGERLSQIKFVQTEAGNPLNIVSEQRFLIHGDIAFFDALIVKFSNEYVQDGKGRALYLWHRVYDEETAPKDAQLIESYQQSPERYFSITKALKVKQRAPFWAAIWDLTNQPEYLSEYGVTAVYGSGIHFKVEAGKVYRFKISPTGQIYPVVKQAP